MTESTKALYKNFVDMYVNEELDFEYCEFYFDEKIYIIDEDWMNYNVAKREYEIAFKNFLKNAKVIKEYLNII